METCYKELEAYNFDPEHVRKCYPFLARHFERSEGSRPPIPVDSPNFREVLAKGVFPYEYIDHADRLRRHTASSHRVIPQLTSREERHTVVVSEIDYVNLLFYIFEE